MSQLDICFYSDDPVATNTPAPKEPAATEQGVDDDPAPDVCECGKCPLHPKEHFGCCQSMRKAKDICEREKLGCICLSPKLAKFLDKVI